MPIYLIFRLASMAAVVAIAARTPEPKLWYSIVFSLGFAHYLVALLYSRNQIIGVFRQSQAVVPLLSLALLGTFLYLSKFSLLIYFALHHAFNEAYVLNHTLPKGDPRVKAFRASSVLLHVLLYFTLLRHTPVLSFLPDELLFGGLVVSYALFFYRLSVIRDHMNLKMLIENCGLEVAGLGLLAASFFVDIGFLQIVLYHFIFWTLYPVPKLMTAGNATLIRYTATTSVVIVGFLLISPIGVGDYVLANSTFSDQFRLWSFIHITTSFALSASHPSWIVELFRGPQKPTREVSSGI